MHKTLLLFFLLFIKSLAGQTVFESRLFNPDCYEESYGVLHLSSHEILVSGAFNCSGSPSDWESYFVYFNKNGDTLETIKSLPQNGLTAKGIAGNFFIAGGNRAGFVYDTIYIWNLDESGSTIWENKIFLPVCNNQATAIKATQDGGVILTAIYSFTDCSAPLYHTAIMKFDNTGKKEWRIDIDNDFNDQIHAIDETTDDYYFAGWSNSSSDGGNNSILLVRSDKNGNLKWQKNIDLGQSSFAYGIGVRADQQIYISGYHSETFLLIADEDGEKKWIKTFGNSCGGRFNKLKITPDNGIAFLSREQVSGNCKSILTKTDLNGDVAWRKNTDALIRDFTMINDSSFILTGNIGHLPDIYLLRFDTLSFPQDTTFIQQFNHPEINSKFDSNTSTFYLSNGKSNSLFSGQIVIYDLSGRRVFKRKFYQTNLINSPLKSFGIFLYQISFENKDIRQISGFIQN